MAAAVNALGMREVCTMICAFEVSSYCVKEWYTSLQLIVVAPYAMLAYTHTIKTRKPNARPEPLVMFPENNLSMIVAPFP